MGLIMRNGVAYGGSGGGAGVGIDDANISAQTTYSSEKIEDLVANNTGGAGIDDSTTSAETTYSSNKIESLVSPMVKTVNGTAPDVNGNVEVAGGNLKYSILTLTEYQALETKDPNTVYFIK